ncbi:SLC13 family permease, partial [Rhodococcus sp. T2V]|uniref:SLC13 family permease n=1 Tax=Rhodococcus sp. T2V TaxID=3034164 RepID=UPI0023E33653
RAAAALNVSPIDIFVPMIPSIAAGLIAVLVLAYFLGRSERKRVGLLTLDSESVEEAALVGSSGGTGKTPDSDKAASEPVRPTTGGGDDVSDFAELPEIGDHLERPKARPKLVWINFTLTAAVMTLLVLGTLAPPVILMLGVGIALIINFPRVSEQADQLKSHASSVVSVVALVFAASVLTGVLSGTGMVEAMAQWLVEIIPTSFGPHLAIVAGLLSLPLTFFMSNDAFFFGVLPVLNETA